MLLSWKIVYNCWLSPRDSILNSAWPSSSWSKQNAISVSTLRLPSVVRRRCCCSCLSSVIQAEEGKAEEEKLHTLQENFGASRDNKWSPNSNSDSPPSSDSRTRTEGEMKGDNRKRKRSDPSSIQVPRQRYIPVSKSELLEAIVSMFQESLNDAVFHEFIFLSSCLDSILHAEHKAVLEEMRADYNSLINSKKEVPNASARDRERHEVEGGEAREERSVNNASPERQAPVDQDNGVNSSSADMERSENQMPFLDTLDLLQIFNSFATNANIEDNSRPSVVAAASRFQRAFLKLLYEARFQELSVRDLILTSTLNTDYLLTLPVYVDWRKASESNAIIFRRGYTTEKQKGRLLVEKLDYLQSKLLQSIFGLVSKPMGKVGIWIKKVLENASTTKEVQVLQNRVHLWVEAISVFKRSHPRVKQTSDVMSETEEQAFIDLPIWVAAQRAVSRYEEILSSVGPRGRLLKRLLKGIGLTSTSSVIPFDLDEDRPIFTQPEILPVFLSRITLADIWRPATRKYCGNDFWKILRTSFSIIFSRSVLQEPAFEELVLLYSDDRNRNGIHREDQVPTLQLKIYEKIPIPDLAVIFPQKKLSFRILDTVRLDIASLLGLLAFLINNKFEDVLSSPSAFLLDVVAISALAIYVTRVALGYKQTWDRYQLLVNRTLYEKTLASGFGAVYFLLDASEQQRFKECILAYALLLKINQATSRKALEGACEQFLHDSFKVKVEMAVDTAVDTLVKFGLVERKTVSDEEVLLEAVPCSVAYDALRKRWDCILN